MRVAVIHGYFLRDSGSGVSVRQQTRELVRQGHDVTLICQECAPELEDFIDSVFTLDSTNSVLTPVGESSTPRYAGRCRLVRPNLGGHLLVYVAGAFPGFDRECVEAFQDAPDDWIDAYVTANTRALRTIFDAWPPEVVLAHHAIMQPVVARRALEGRAPYVAITHGSELNFSIKRDPRLVPYAIEGLSAAAAVIAISQPATDELLAWAATVNLDIADKTVVVPPGIDHELFSPAADREVALDALRRDVPLPEGFELRPDDVVLAFAGRLMWTKGVQHAVAALPVVAAEHQRVKLLVAGDGPARPALEQLARFLDAGDYESARNLAESNEELRTMPDNGPVIPAGTAPVPPRSEPGAPRCAFLGHLTSEQLARVFATADASIASSVFPEALGLVTIEALSCGALPIVAYHSGLASIADLVSESLSDDELRRLESTGDLTTGLADLTTHVLARYPTQLAGFRDGLHGLSVVHFPGWGEVVNRYIELGLKGASAQGPMNPN